MNRILHLAGKIAFGLGYLVGSAKWWLGIYVRIDDWQKPKK